jgi:MinD superfamily P-loop ATPase
VKQVTVLSGKGGTGKTSLTAAFASLAGSVVLVDCDVDAANLHLVMSPVVEERHEFVGGAKARIDGAACTGCGQCVEACRFEALRMNGVAEVDSGECEGCGVCVDVCPERAVELARHVCGEWYISRTRCGEMVHARLKPGDENSGKLVSTLRQAAKELAKRNGAAWILADGPPGIGCPVIASLSGADYAVLVTEPTLSGMADLERVAGVARHFGVPAGILVNRADINRGLAARIEKYAAANEFTMLGRVECDAAFSEAQRAGEAVLSRAGGLLRRTLENAWLAVENTMEKERNPFTVMR